MGCSWHDVFQYRNFLDVPNLTLALLRNRKSERSSSGRIRGWFVNTLTQKGITLPGSRGAIYPAFEKSFFSKLVWWLNEESISLGNCHIQRWAQIGSRTKVRDEYCAFRGS